MTPEQVKAWQDQHGGPGENTPSPPDSQGLVTHRAADGAWMVVGPSGMVSQGSSPGVVDGGSPEQGAGAPGAASTATAVTNDAQLRAWLEAHGGGPGVNKNNERQVEGPVDPQTGVATKVRAVDSTTVTAPDGATLTLRRPSSGQGYEQVSETLPKKPAAGATRTPEQQANDAAIAKDNQIKADDALRIKNESEWNANPANAAAGGSGRYETHADRDARLAKEKIDADTRARQAAADAAKQQPDTISELVPGHPGIFAVTVKVPATATTPASSTIHFEDSTGKTVPQPPDAPTYTTTQHTINGQQHISIIKTPKDGSPPTITNYGPDGKEEAQLPTEGIGNVKDLPVYTPDLTKRGQGLFEYGKQLDEYMAAHPDFTFEKRQTVMDAAQKLATQVASEFNTSATILREQYQTSVTQRGQDISQSNSRATLADDHFKNAMGMIEKFGPYLGANSGKLFMGMMAAQLATATAYGGMQNTPRAEMDPRLVQFANQHIGGPAAPGAPTPPNALGLGAIGNQPAPGTPGAALGAVLPPATIANTPDAQGMLATNEANRQLDLANQGAAAAAPVDASAPAPVTAGPPPPLAAGQDLSTPPPAGVNPAAGDPGNNPAQPISMAPPPNPSVANLFANVLPDPMTSWRQDAQQRADALTPANPAAIANGERLFGSGVPSAPLMFGGPGTFSMGTPTPPAPMALQSNIQGLTPDVDAEARRQLAAEGVLV